MICIVESAIESLQNKNTIILRQGLRFPLARSPAASQNQLGRVKVIC